MPYEYALSIIRDVSYSGSARLVVVVCTPGIHAASHIVPVSHYWVAVGADP
jgi:hypothetical protein